THADGISNAEAALGLEFHNGLLFGDPVGPRVQFSIVDKEVSVVGQCICRQAKSSSSRRFEGPASKQTVELVVDVGIADDIAAGISQQCAFHNPDLVLLVLFSIIKTQEFEQFLIPAFADGIVQLAHLPESCGQDLKLDRVIGSMFDERVAGLKLKLAREFANPQNRRPTEPAAFAEDRIHQYGYFQAGFYCTLGQNNV